MAADRIARSTDISDVRLHIGRVVFLLAATIAVITAIVLMLTSAA